MTLNTIEKFILLAQHPDKGRFVTSDMHMHYGIIGALLLEMSFDKRITIENNLLIANPNHHTVGTSLEDELLIEIKKATKPKKINKWLYKFVRKAKTYKKKIVNQLSDKRLVKIEKKKFLGLIPYQKTYLIDKRTRERLIRELSAALFSKEKISNENILLLALIEACRMHKILSRSKKDLKSIKKETKRIIKENPIAESVDKTVQEVQAAIITTIIASSAATTVATSSS